MTDAGHSADVDDLPEVEDDDTVANKIVGVW